jgi:Tol biopolymer transport system component
MLTNVQDANWAADGENMAVVRFMPETFHWRLEYPVGKVLFDSINWISHPKISPDGKLIAFADHENPIGDDQGSVAVIDSSGHERKLSSGWSSLEGIEWSASGDEIWFAASNSGAANNLRGVTLAGKLRNITNVPGGMWFEDIHNNSTLMIVHQQRWSFDKKSLRPVPGLDSKYVIVGWAPDGTSLYVSSRERWENTTAQVYRVNIATGKMDFWKEFGTNLPTGTAGVGPPEFSSGNRAYAYLSSQVLSEAYVVKGLK